MYTGERLECDHVASSPDTMLQIVQAEESIDPPWLTRDHIAPVLSRIDGISTLVMRCQGEYGKFAVPYIATHILCNDAEQGLVVVLVSYHGASVEKYGRIGYKTQKGQFYHYYRCIAGGWQQVSWRDFNDETREYILEIYRERAPGWARVPGKLASEHKPRARVAEAIAYKVVRVIGGRYFSIYNPNIEYILGQRLKQAAKSGHTGGFFSFPKIEMSTEYLASCMRSISLEIPETDALALLECEIGGRIIKYGGKQASTYLCPIRVLEMRAIPHG